MSFFDDFAQYTKTFGEQPQGYGEEDVIDPVTGQITKPNVAQETVQDASMNNQLEAAATPQTQPLEQQAIPSAEPTQGVSTQDVENIAKSSDITNQDTSAISDVAKTAETQARTKMMQTIADRQGGNDDQKPYDPTGKTAAQIAAETGQQSALDEAEKNGVSFAEVLSFKGDPNGKVTSQDISAYKALKDNGQLPLDMVKPMIGNGMEKYQPRSEVRAMSAEEKIPGQDEAGDIQAEMAQSQGGIGFEKVYRDGYQFRPKGQNDLTGQCAWFAQQLTTLPNGEKWTIGSTLPEKKAQLAGHVENGNAFYRGQDVPAEGNSIVFNGGQYGHVAVVKEILPGGKARLTESNYGNDQRVSNSRVISLNDPSIMGYVRTKSRY